MAYYKKDEPTVYHVCSNCTEGNNIEEVNLIIGQPPPGAILCEKCNDLKRQGKCEYGIPNYKVAPPI